MIMLSTDWSYALLLTGVGIGTVFLLLIVLIWVIGLQTKVVNSFSGNSGNVHDESAATATTDTHPTPHEQAAIATAMYLYCNVHDEEPHVITIENIERRYSPWSSKIYSMRNTPTK